VAHYWRHPGLPRVNLLRARFVTHRYTRHSHEGYTIGLIESGAEEFDHQGAVERAGPGAVVILNPVVVHTGRAAVPEGWAYRVVYPAVDVVAGIAADLGAPPGTPRFPGPRRPRPRRRRAAAARGPSSTTAGARRTWLP
jgi:hypothetical protein